MRSLLHKPDGEGTPLLDRELPLERIRTQPVSPRTPEHRHCETIIDNIVDVIFVICKFKETGINYKYWEDMTVI